MPRHLLPALLAGMLAGGMFLLIIFTKLHPIFSFSASLPLFFIGLRQGHRDAFTAVLTAFLLISIGGGPAPGIFFMLTIGLPAGFMVRQSLLHRDETQWFPIGLIVLSLALYAASIMALIAWYFAYEPGGLEQVIASNIKEAFALMGEQYAAIGESLATSWPFLIFPVTWWLWGLMLYGYAWIAQKILVDRREMLRPGYGIEPFTMPRWMLALLAIGALASLIGSPQMRFLGKSEILILLLPYFFLGIALLHRNVREWPNGRFFLFFVYFLAFSLFWPALLIAGIGLVYQIKNLSVHGKNIG